MQCLFGTEISGNRRPGAELLETVRAGIITVSEARVLKLKIAAEYRVNWLTVSRLARLAARPAHSHTPTQKYH